MIKLAVVTSVSTVSNPKIEVIKVEPDQWLPRSALPPDDYSRCGLGGSGGENAVYVPIVEDLPVARRTWIPEAALTYLKEQPK